jgi:PD-(D/E)XK nuclease superfamily
MTTIPIPLIDGAFLIDNSSLEQLRCPRLYQQKLLQKRTPVAERAGANFGSTMHRGWQSRYELCGNKEVNPTAEAVINEAMNAWLLENPQPPQDFRNFNHACRVMAVYNKQYKNENFKILVNPKDGKPIIESSFALPIGTVQNIPIIYCGKVDLGIEDPQGTWSFDHKTTFQFGRTFEKQMEMDGGQLGYMWALWQATGKLPMGYIIDAVRIRKPSKGDDFAGTAPIDGSDFLRIPFPKTQDVLEDWKNNVLSLVDDLFHYHDKSYFPMHRWHCTNKFGLCDFIDVCSTVPSQREMVLQSNLYEENTWTPLKGTKE